MPENHSHTVPADGGLMDGGHRLARALIDGHTHIDAVRFEVDPDPDWFIPDGDH